MRTAMTRGTPPATKASALTFVVFAIAGFCLTLSTCPQTALYRAVLDTVALIAMALIQAFISSRSKRPVLPVGTVVAALRELAQGHCHKRLRSEALGDLADIGQAFNDLAERLAHKPHAQQTARQSKDEAVSEQQSTKSATRAQTINQPQPVSGAARSAQVSLSQEEMRRLHQQLVQAQTASNEKPMDFASLQRMVAQTTEYIFASHKDCTEVSFEVTRHNGKVALQPRIIRTSSESAGRGERGLPQSTGAEQNGGPGKYRATGELSGAKGHFVEKKQKGTQPPGGSAEPSPKAPKSKA
ncbi:MAG: hypothetical protein AAF471_00515 [Myxococcota bacterium]